MYVHFGGVNIPNCPFTVMVTDFVSILLVFINSALCPYHQFCFISLPFNCLLGRGKGPASEPLDGICRVLALQLG
jgi:hypothetical protein